MVKKDSDHLRHLSTNVLGLLNLMPEKQGMKVWLGLNWLSIRGFVNMVMNFLLQKNNVIHRKIMPFPQLSNNHLFKVSLYNGGTANNAAM